MLIRTTILVILIASCYSAEQCKVYSCGQIEQKADATICAQRSGDGSSWATQSCPDGQYCQVDDFYYPYQVDALDLQEAYCGDEEPKIIEDDFFPNFGVGLDGDYCEEDFNCYTSEFNQATCVENKCQSSTVKDDECSPGYHHDCPRGHFCNAETRRCAVAEPTGNDCDTHHGCLYDHRCVDIHGDERGPICVLENSLENGVIFDTLYLEKNVEKRSDSKKLAEERPQNPILSVICKSRSELHLETGFIQCRKANSNVNKDIWTVTPGEDCIVETYNDPDPANYDKKSTLLFESQCGFNQDSRAWCPLMIGDKYAEDLYVSYMERLGQLDCFKKYENSPREGRVCHDYYKAMQDKDEGVFKSFYLSLLVSTNPEAPYFEEPILFSNTASNDQCVKDTLTYLYWNGYGQDMSPYNLLKISK